MVSSRWNKVLRDLWNTKTRTILVVLSIAVGVFAMGTVVHMNTIVSHDMTESYNAINPADAILYVGASFDDVLIETVRNVPGVRVAQNILPMSAEQYHFEFPLGQ